MIPGTQITWVDAVVGLILVVFAVFGLGKGFVKQFFGLAGGIIVILVAWLLAGAVARLLDIIMGAAIENSFTDWMIQMDSGRAEGDKFFTVVKDWSLEENIVSALIIMGLPSWGAGLLQGTVESTFVDFGQTQLVQVLPRVLSMWILTAIGFVLLVIVFAVLMIKLKNTFERLTEKGGSKVIDRCLGMCVSLVIGYVIIGLMFTLLKAPPLSSINDTIQQNVGQSWLTATLFEKNPIADFIKNIFYN